jgi:hypothetical protein
MRFKVIALAIVAVLTVGVVAAQAGKTKRFNSTVTLQYDPANGGPYDPYGEDKFKGKVDSPKRKCKVNRKVVVKNAGGGTVGSDLTNQRGNYVVDAGGATAGDYYAVAKRKKFGRRTKKICKRAESNVVSVP